MSESAVSLNGIVKRYGKRTALAGVDLEVPRGSLFAVLGPNGAGKTTLLRCLTGMIRADGGTGQVLGEPLSGAFPSRELKERMGYVAQNPVLYERMTAADLSDLCRGLHRRWDEAVVRRYMDMFGLPARLPVRQMSMGMRSQLALTLVMGGNPELLILDEPTLGLDPLHRYQYLQVLLADSLDAGRTLILSSHDLHQIERLADRVAILSAGRVAVTGLVDDLKLLEKRVRVAGEVSEGALLAVPGVRRVVRERAGWLLTATGEAEALRQALLGVPGVAAVQVLEQSLEEIFMSYVS